MAKGNRMLKLVDDYLEKELEFQKSGIIVPKFEQLKMSEETSKKPKWVHFGGGNLFRCFHASIAQKLINSGEMDTGIIVVETYDDEIIEKMYHPYNNRFLSVVMKSNGVLEKELLASVSDSLYLDTEDETKWDKIISIFENPSLQLVTFSITEKGYSIRDSQGNIKKAVLRDMTKPERPTTNIGIVTKLLYKRWKAGKYPIALVSTDNFSENGEKLKEDVLTIAQKWVQNELVEQCFYDYLVNPKKVEFPWSMIDRITPNPSEIVGDSLYKSGFEDVNILKSVKQTNIAPFGNTEETHYLVIEDAFPNGRPNFEKAGVMMTDRETVNDADQMKVTACLNPLHTALAIFGSMMGFNSIAEEMHDSELLELVKKLGYTENLPVVKDPKIINPKEFLDELISSRLPNRNIPDTPQRIASDTSQKIPIRYGVTIKKYIDNPNRSVSNLEIIPLVLAGWCRYLVGLDDELNKFNLSPDPLLDELTNIFKDVKADGSITQTNAYEILKPLLSNKEIFGVDLYKIGMNEKIEKYFSEMLNGPGAVRETIKRVIEKNKKQ